VLSVSSIVLFPFHLYRVTLLSVFVFCDFVFCDVWILFPPVSAYVPSIDFPLETDENIPMICPHGV
jgi:hypothetical protein